MSGEIVILVVFVEAFLISLFLLSLPFLTIKKGGSKLSAPEVAYFLSVGAGFMFVELYFIKQFILLFGNPVISFTVVLSGILVFSALGGFWSQYMSYKGIKKTLICLIILLVIIFLGLETVTYEILGLPDTVQYILAILILLPCGVLIGLPFPLGMRYMIKSSAKRAHAWTANGCTSVLMSIIAAQIALSLGISYIIAGAAASYFLAFVVTSNARLKKTPRPLP
jgi:predicted membrane-bound spermidine synthase